MDKTTIGLNAGIVWHLLNDNNRKWEYNELRDASRLSDRDLNAAIGWLARENKIEFCHDDQTDTDSFFITMNIYI